MLGAFVLPLFHAIQQFPLLWGIVAAGFFGLTRRFPGVIHEAIIDCFYLSASISEDDPAYSWAIFYLISNTISLEKKPSLITDLIEAVFPSGTSPARRLHFTSNRPWSSLDDEEYHSQPWYLPKSSKTSKYNVPIYVHPAFTSAQCVKYQGQTLTFYLDEAPSAYERGTLHISTVGRSRTLFTRFLNDAREAFIETGTNRLAVYEPRPDPPAWASQWRIGISRDSRPLKSIFLPEGIKEDLVADIQEFIAEKEFYRDRGVPYRRGWLLYGVPGSGKTSLVGALASELQLDIYFISLGSNGIDDSRLVSLFRAAPKKCIIVLEDIDCATTEKRQKKSKKVVSSSSASEAESSTESVLVKTKNRRARIKENERKNKSEVTLAGLLNAIDGIASSEGRLLFCTTNHLEDLDPALIRPGRCDVKVEFKNATASQAKQLFSHFYTVRSSTPPLPNDLDSYPEVEQMLIESVLSMKTSTLENPNIEELAVRFSNELPEGATSVSAIQGYLMRHKRMPQKALDDLAAWVASRYDQGPATTLRAKVDVVPGEEADGAIENVEEHEKLACDSEIVHDD